MGGGEVEVEVQPEPPPPGFLAPKPKRNHPELGCFLGSLPRALAGIFRIIFCICDYLEWIQRMFFCTSAWVAAKWIESPEKRGIFEKQCTENPGKTMDFCQITH